MTGRSTSPENGVTIVADVGDIGLKNERDCRRQTTLHIARWQTPSIFITNALHSAGAFTLLPAMALHVRWKWHLSRRRMAPAGRGWRGGTL